MSAKHFALLTVMIMALAAPVLAQDDAGSNDPWALVRGLEGTWEGTGENFGKASTVTHKWEFVLDGKFLRLEARSVTESGTGGNDVHQDVGYVSWSEGEGVLRFRQFVSEGFVNTFTLEEARASQPGINFEPEGTEGMETMSARMTLRFQDEQSYEMVLELGVKGKKLTPCQTMRMQKVE